MAVADGILRGLGPCGEGDSEDVSAQSEGQKEENGELLPIEGSELLPREQGEGRCRVDEGPGSRHEEEAGRVDLVPPGVGEDADDDAGGKESGRRADEGAEQKSATHENEREEEDGLARPTTGWNGPVRAGFRIKVEIVPVVEEAAAQIEAGEGQSDEAQTDGAEVGLVFKKIPSYEDTQKSVRPNSGEVCEPAHGEKVDDFLAGHLSTKESKGAWTWEV